MAAHDLANFATRIEAREGRVLTPGEIFEIARARESALSRLLILYVSTGLAFMLLPGTFLGVWNLIHISSRAAANAVSAPWIQAHGMAQIYGWIGSFILGIGFYSLPKLRRMEPFALWTAKLCWALWAAGVLLRWLTNVYQWHWRLLLPVSASLQLMAFLIFFYSVLGHKANADPGEDRGRGRPRHKSGLELWARIVIGGTCGMLLSLLLNLGGALYVAVYGADAAFSAGFDHRFLVLTTWGFLVPFVWGFSAKWLPVFLGLRPSRNVPLATAALMALSGVGSAMVGLFRVSAFLLLFAALLAPFSLRVFETPQQAPKLIGVHGTFPLFVRVAYAWSIVAGALGIWAAYAPAATGITGASRHALTVGFIATMVFSIGQRILPAFSGMRLLFSPRLMWAGLTLLTAGCALRVSAEILAYQGYIPGAWSWLPVSAVTELTAVTLFAVNVGVSFARRPAAHTVNISGAAAAKAPRPA